MLHQCPEQVCHTDAPFNSLDNACDTRYRITLGGLDVLRPLCIYVESVE
jgi:hypothetical protein